MSGAGSIKSHLPHGLDCIVHLPPDHQMAFTIVEGRLVVHQGQLDTEGQCAQTIGRDIESTLWKIGLQFLSTIMIIVLHASTLLKKL